MRKYPSLLLVAFAVPGSISGIDGFGDRGIGMSSFKPSVSFFSFGSGESRIENPSTSSSSSSSSSTSSEPVDYFYCDRYGPFPLSNPINTDVTFTYELNSIASQDIIERMRILRNGSVVASSSMPSKAYVTGTRNNVTFTLPLQNYWTSAGLKVIVEIINSSTREVLKDYSAYLYPPKNDFISASTLKSVGYCSDSLGFYGDGTTLKEVYEMFDFTRIGDYLDVDYYYRLDIKNNKFYYPNPYPLNYSSINLRFNDDERLFPRLAHESNGDIIIPLSLTKDGDTVSFKYKNKFYVNKRSLDVSNSYIANYVLSDDLYLPINRRKAFNGKTLYIEINGLGLDNISTIIPLRYESSRSIIGLCTDGENYVVGGNK